MSPAMESFSADGLSRGTAATEGEAEEEKMRKTGRRKQKQMREEEMRKNKQN